MEFQQSFYARPHPPGTMSMNNRGAETGPKRMSRGKDRPSTTWTYQPLEFVFIDESQRDSKRLKITRACESCRRRKVRCDAPHVAPGDSCTSCRRLNVECVLQQLGVEDERLDRIQSGYDKDERTLRTTSKSDYITRDITAQTLATPANSSPRSMTGSDSGTHLRVQSSGSGRDRSGSSNASTRPGPMPIPVSLSTSENVQVSSLSNSAMLDAGDSTLLAGENTLTDIFGNLNITLSGRAAFVDDDQHRGLPPYSTATFHKNLSGMSVVDSPGYPVSFEEIEDYLPVEDLAASLISLYFENVHPYLPVVNKTVFYQDWLSSKRRSMSPYLLLSLFACAARYSSDIRVRLHSNDPSSAGDLWYTLAAKYKDEFMDAPRISTLQAEVINLKALETRPRIRGYSYRCWFLLSSILRMGKDMGLHKMTTQHANDPDSVTGRRLWQICLIMDQMMGTAQGRELQLDMAEVDLTLLPESQSSIHGLDLNEVRIQNDFVYMTGLVKILRRCTEVHNSVGVRFPFAAEPQYPALSDILLRWRENLPEHLKFEALTTNVLPSHFVAHLHLSYCMCVCLLHRPWIVSVGEYGATGEWREHLRMCNDAARQALRLYEMLLDQYGAPGIKWMIRGNNYAVYGAIIMTMIHAVCVTCPEKEFCDGGRESFNRAIRVLDRLAEINSTPQMQKQLSVLKGIFGSPNPTGEPKFETRSLPPELATLQEQYIMMQNNDARRRAKARRHDSSVEMMAYERNFGSNPGSFMTPQSQDYPVVPSESYYHTLPPTLDHAVSGQSDHLANDPDQTQQDGSPGRMAWNPAGLIGAWNLNFPLASSGFQYLDHDFAIQDPNMAPQSQLPRQHNPGHLAAQQEYVPFTYNDGFQ
ncbi:putative C6 finger domain protein [Taphrina deformans PYCC 5710]|uniref:C6 finger domain protein n=1 Tax=Taphrina deformans (strain PYCC 5710 / ATCC 11124 / CBS 356.35 / IMI 108563 / JCM 9778 / NBRC 8474) TaxID=1097556 RepID=R4X921_TAPDE|nr:putative C6 finger domain protein [Taphrina deformans PYCC 5710]|eukprot:CCG81925.1 putative C6 finger domain protein [Taphrina deformans PYCC 5710]